MLQTPNSPVAAGSSGGRKASKRIILVCYGTTQGDSEVDKETVTWIVFFICAYDLSYFIFRRSVKLIQLLN